MLRCLEPSGEQESCLILPTTAWPVPGAYLAPTNVCGTGIPSSAPAKLQRAKTGLWALPFFHSIPRYMADLYIRCRETGC